MRQPPELENRMARRPRPERASLMPRHAAPRHAMPGLESVVLGSWGKTMVNRLGIRKGKKGAVRLPKILVLIIAAIARRPEDYAAPG